MKTGDSVLIGYDGHTVEGMIALASENERSLMLLFDDAILGGHIGVMPVLLDDNGVYRSVFTGEAVTIELQSEAAQ